MQLGNVTGCKNAGCTKGNPGCAKRQVAYRRKVVNSDLGEPILSNLFKQFPNMLVHNGPNGFIPNWRLWIRRPGSKPEHVTINMDQVTPTARIVCWRIWGKVWLENSHTIHTQSLISWAYLYMNYVTFFGISPMFLWSQVPTQDAPQPPSHLFNGGYDVFWPFGETSCKYSRLNWNCAVWLGF